MIIDAHVERISMVLWTEIIRGHKAICRGIKYTANLSTKVVETLSIGIDIRAAIAIHFIIL